MSSLNSSGSVVGGSSILTGKSTLSTESPPFNPHGGRTGLLSSPSGNSTSSAYEGRVGGGTTRSALAMANGTGTPTAIGAGSGSLTPGVLNMGGANSASNVINTGGNNLVNSMDQSNNPASNAIPKYTFKHGNNETLEIRNVWAENVEEEMANVREIIQKYPYVAMDTEFPGVVAKPVTESYSHDYHYKLLKVNVDLLKIIQLGLCFADAEGNFAPGCPCWQFNFSFDVDEDMFAQDSIDLLIKSGISFRDHKYRGIEPNLFGELLMVSGLVLDDRVRWVSFHSGYDYGYLLKLLTTVSLPNDEKGFKELMKIYFPTVYDVKYMASLLDGQQFLGGLQKIADDLGCQRLGTEHQAGSDSLLTMSSYFELARSKFSLPANAMTPSKGNRSKISKATKADTAKNNSDKSNDKDSNSEKSKPKLVIIDGKFRNELFGYGSNHTVRKGGPKAQHDAVANANAASGLPMSMKSITMDSLAAFGKSSGGNGHSKRNSDKNSKN